GFSRRDDRDGARARWDPWCDRRSCRRARCDRPLRLHLAPGAERAQEPRPRWLQRAGRLGTTKPAYRSSDATVRAGARAPTPSPASAVPSAATVTPASTSAFPAGRLRNVATATATTATVPIAFP